MEEMKCPFCGNNTWRTKEIKIIDSKEKVAGTHYQWHCNFCGQDFITQWEMRVKYIETVDKIKKLLDMGFEVMLSTHTIDKERWEEVGDQRGSFSVVQIFEVGGTQIPNDSPHEDDWGFEYDKENIHQFEGEDLDMALDKAIKFAKKDTSKKK